MFDIKWIRDHPEAFDQGMEARGLPPQSAEILSLDQQRREAQTALQEMQARRNEASKAIGQKKKAGEDAEPLMAEVAALKNKMAAGEETARRADEALEALLSGLPNIPVPEVPIGPDESANELVRNRGSIPNLEGAAKQHFELGEALGQMDFEMAAKLSGSRFVLLRGEISRLSRALANFMIDLHTSEHGYLEVSPPYLVRDHVLYGTGQLPKFGEDLFKTEEGFWLIPTAEVPLTNLVRESIVEEGELPKRFTALTPCFRSEAGSAGRDTRGMLRQHQFDKVELVSAVHPDRSMEELERMLNCAEEVLNRLGLAYRVMLLSSGDMSAASRKTYDIEVWLPGQETYREISSCSNCWDYQARRMAARFRPEGEKATRFLHTLNGSGVAVGRALIAVMENYQQADGSIVIPEAVRPYMGGQEIIAAHD